MLVKVITYGYDKNNRLLKEMKASGENETDTTRYGYDANGNQIYKENETLKPAATGDTESLNIYIVGQDASNDASIYQYDGLNQLTKSIVGDKTVTYGYDGNGLRTSKTVNGSVTTEVWDGDQIALELNGVGAVTNKYVRGINLIYGDDGTGSNKKFYLFNGHGDVIQLTDNTGTVVKNYDYDAFGNEKNIDPNDTNVFRHCGEYFDKETSTMYLRARYYDPEIGRFITEDSLEGKINDPLSLDLYTYCKDDPVNMVDSDGHSPTFYKTDKGKWKFMDENKFINADIGFLGFVPFLDNAVWALSDWLSGTKTVSVSDYNSYISGALGVLGNISKLGKIATAASGVSNILTGANIIKELKSNSNYTNQIAAVVFDDYYESKSFETTVKKFALYVGVTQDLIDKKIITYKKDGGNVSKIKVDWTKFDDYFKRLGKSAEDIGKSIK